MDETKAFAREYGYVETIFGRRAHYPEIRSSNPQVRAFNERASINARLQGTAADIIRRAMIRMDDALAYRPGFQPACSCRCMTSSSSKRPRKRSSARCRSSRR